MRRLILFFSIVNSILALQDQPNPPNIKLQISKVPESFYFMKGESFTLNCSAEYSPDYPIAIEWSLPRRPKDTDIYEDKIINTRNVPVYYKTLTITNTERDDEGKYTCIANTAAPNTNRIERMVEKKYLEHPFINMKKYGDGTVLNMERHTLTMLADVAAYPPLVFPRDFTFLRDDQPLIIDNKKYRSSFLQDHDVTIFLTINNPTVSDNGKYTIVARKGHVNESVTFVQRLEDKLKHHIKIQISRVPKSSYFMKGENFTLNCSIEYKHEDFLDLEWSLPRPPKVTDFILRSLKAENKKNIYNNFITIKNAERGDEGSYECFAPFRPIKKEMMEMKYLEHPFINMKKYGDGTVLNMERHTLTMLADVEAYPPLVFPQDFTFLRDDQPLIIDHKKYESTFLQDHDVTIFLMINNPTVSDNGKYTIVARKGHVNESVTFVQRLKADPVVYFDSSKDEVFQYNSLLNLSCEATGNPLPNITWIFSPENVGSAERFIEGVDTMLSEFKVKSTLILKAVTSGNITCKAVGKAANAYATKRILINETAGGVGIDGPKWYLENDKVLKEYSNVTWGGQNDTELAENGRNKVPDETETLVVVNSTQVDCPSSPKQTFLGDVKKYEAANKAFGESIAQELAFVPVSRRRFVMYQMLGIIENNS